MSLKVTWGTENIKEVEYWTNHKWYNIYHFVHKWINSLQQEVIKVRQTVLYRFQ